MAIVEQSDESSQAADQGEPPVSTLPAELSYYVRSQWAIHRARALQLTRSEALLLKYLAEVALGQPERKGLQRGQLRRLASTIVADTQLSRPHYFRLARRLEALGLIRRTRRKDRAALIEIVAFVQAEMPLGPRLAHSYGKSHSDTCVSINERLTQVSSGDFRKSHRETQNGGGEVDPSRLLSLNPTVEVTKGLLNEEGDLNEEEEERGEPAAAANQLDMLDVARRKNAKGLTWAQVLERWDEIPEVGAEAPVDRHSIRRRDVTALSEFFDGGGFRVRYRAWPPPLEEAPAVEEEERQVTSAPAAVVDGSVRATWETVLARLELQVSKPSFATWLRDTYVVSYDADRMVVGTASPFAARWLEQRMSALVEATLSQIAGRPSTVRFRAPSRDET